MWHDRGYPVLFSVFLFLVASIGQCGLGMLGAWRDLDAGAGVPFLQKKAIQFDAGTQGASD